MEQLKAEIEFAARDRQLAAYGVDTQRDIMALRVFLLGLRGLGVEIAKNLVLAGIGKLTICDNALVEISDLGANYLLEESQVGKLTRAQAVLPGLRSLNSAVSVQLSTTHSISDICSNHNCVIVSDCYDADYLIALDAACTRNRAGFIYTGSLGLYGFTFVNFGQAHKIHDQDGQEYKPLYIDNIEQKNGRTTVSLGDTRHHMQDGDLVQFRQVQGIPELNIGAWEVNILYPLSFSIQNLQYVEKRISRGGFVEKVKLPALAEFKSLREGLDNPLAPCRKFEEFENIKNYMKYGRNPYLPAQQELDRSSWEETERPQQLHILLRGILEYYRRHRHLPELLKQSSAEELVTIVQEITDASAQNTFKVSKVDKQLISNAALYAETQIAPCCVFWGGIVAQQVLKITGKYTPLRQWLHQDFLGLLPEQVDRGVVNTRYRDYVALFGKQFLEDGSKTNVLLAGAGHLGCEYIKMCSLMGLSTQANLICVDDENIQLRNIYLEHLYTKKDIGKFRSEVACAIASHINPQAMYISKVDSLSQSSDPFPEDFWIGLDLFISTKDKQRVSHYLDRQSISYSKFWIDSGVVGLNGHSQVIIPDATESYGETDSPATYYNQVDLSTSKNFPYEIDHVIQDARGFFQTHLVEAPIYASKYLADPHKYLESTFKQLRNRQSSLRNRLQMINAIIDVQQKGTYEACVEHAMRLFHENFNTRIANLLGSFPKDYKIEQTSQLFWKNGRKKCPDPIRLDIGDPLHMQFVQSTADIFAFVFGLEANRKDIARIVKQASVDNRPVYRRHYRRPPLPEEIEVESEDDDDVAILRLEKELSFKKLSRTGKWSLIEFGNDITGCQVSQLGSCTNLRARNYHIKEVDDWKVNLRAELRTPLVGTTVAAVAGISFLQIIKRILKQAPPTFKNTFVSLSQPMIVLSDPAPPKKSVDKQYDHILCGPSKCIPPGIPYYNGGFTTWDRILVKGPLTLRELFVYMEATYQVRVTMVSIASNSRCIVYNTYTNQALIVGRLDMLVPQAIAQASNQPIDKSRRWLPIQVCGDHIPSNIDALMPTVYYEI